MAGSDESCLKGAPTGARTARLAKSTAMKDQLNGRQLQTIRCMLDEEPNGFAGDMSVKKYLPTTGNQATVAHNLQDLADKEVFTSSGTAEHSLHD